MSVSNKVSDLSASGYPTSLNLFSLPITNVAFTKWSYKEIIPLNPVSDSPFIMRHFSDTCWLNLSKIYVQLELEVQKQENKTWVSLEDADTSVALSQYCGLTYFRQLKVSLNNQEIYDSGTLYGYSAFITNELSCSTNVKNTELACAGYALTKKYNESTDAGFLARNAMIRNGTAQFFSRLNFDLANQPNLLVNDVDLVFTLYKAEDNFVLENLGNLVCRVVPKSIKLYVQTIEVQPSLNVKFFEMLDKQPANYAYRRTEVRSYFLSAGRQEAEINLHVGTVPRRIILGMVENSAFIGAAKKCAFNFEHFKLREIQVTAGSKTCPSVPYSIDYSKDHYGRVFSDMYNGLNQHFDSGNCGITFEQFKSGWNFYIFDLSSSGSGEDSGFELLSTSSTNAKLVFNAPIASGGVELIAFSEFDALLSIDKYRRVMINE